MYATSLRTDRWHGIEDHGEDLPRPSWDDIENAIRRLDAATYTMATIEGGQPAHLYTKESREIAHLTVGGGGGRYVVYLTYDNQSFFTLRSGNGSSSRVMLFIGGQQGDYEADIVVGLDAALAAAKTFAESGKRDETQLWENK